MSASPIARSPDLRRLVEAGHDLTVLGGLLLVRGVPYLDADRRVLAGTLVVRLRLAGDATAAPAGHLASWIGLTPHAADGSVMTELVWSRTGEELAPGLETTHRLCIRPPGREFHDYHELVTTYVRLLGIHVEAVSPGSGSWLADSADGNAAGSRDASAPPPWTGGRRRVPEAARFRYADTASSRAGLDALNARLDRSVGIVGLGGTGSHVLDLVAKTSVATIHLFDADAFEQHNAFRAPGAASRADVAAGRTKADHFAAVYSAMRAGIVPHPVRIDASNADLLDGLGFCFVCVDDSRAKTTILDRLSAAGTSWIDVGMGLEITGAGVVGALRTTVGTSATYADARRRIPEGGPVDDAYATNVQTGDLNALNAALAVVEWKRLRGFYASSSSRLNSVLVVGDGDLHLEPGS